MLSNHAKKILLKRYVLKDREGQPIERPEEVFPRVATALSSVEEEGQRSLWRQKFLEVMENGEFLPNSPCIANAGRPGGQLSACFVLPVPDSIEGIFDAVKYAALVHRTGGGTGFSFGSLRHKDSIVESTGHNASGPVSFMAVFDAATAAIKQGGMRRGANMGILPVTHPDILEFIHCKDSGSAITNFNISVGITDSFMKALQKGESYHLVDPNTGKATGLLDATYVFDELAKSAWRTGDPGVVFLDTINNSRANPIRGWVIGATNPCGEQPLYPYDACTLGSINLSKFYVNGEFDYVRLGEVVKIAVRMLDNTLDVSEYPLKEIKTMVQNIRRIGLGVMGLADLFFLMKIKYNSKKAVELSYDLSHMINEAAVKASEDLAKERGSFPLCDQSIYSKNPRRNSTVTTIAPTGTISLIANCSSGIEPVYKLEVIHKGLEGDLQDEVIRNPVWEASNDKSAEYFVEAHSVEPYWHLQHQIAWQSNVENAVSKTINLPHSATWEDIRQIYQDAYENSCKGVTVYRDGCRDTQVLNSVNSANNNSTVPVSTGSVDTVGTANQPRPSVLPAKSYRQPTPLGNLYVHITENDNTPYEVFAQISKAGSDTMAFTEAICRLISTFLHYVPISHRAWVLAETVRQLELIGGGVSSGFGQNRVRSVPDALAQVITKYLNEDEDDSSSSTIDGGTPNSGALLVEEAPATLEFCAACGNNSVLRQEGCGYCTNCGESLC